MKKDDFCDKRFHELCCQDLLIYGSDGDGIGTYNEKRFHRIFKRYVTENAECYEVKVGKYVADVLCDGHVTEIQTKSYSKIAPKIAYYLGQTEYSVSVILPLVSKKRIIRADKQTGEVMYTRRSPIRISEYDALSELYYLRDYIGSERLLIHILMVSAEEYRYSERVKYRRSGAYDNDLRPVDILDEIVLQKKKDYERFVPESLKNGEFDAKQYAKATALRGRALYSALNTLYEIGVLTRRAEGKRFIYGYVEQNV